MNYQIRQIEEKDNAAVENVIRSCLIEFDCNHPGTAWEDDLAHFSFLYQGAGNRYWVAEDENGKVVAGAGIGYLTDTICELQKMYCLPHARGMGVGQKLMETALSYAGKYYKQCYLETRENMTGAKRLYEKNGFYRLKEKAVQTAHFNCDVPYIRDLG